MANKPGNPNGAGRKKGIPNKRTQTVQKMLDDMGCNPIEAMARILLDEMQKGEGMDRQLVVTIADKLAPYHSPKLSSSKIDAVVAELTHEDRLKHLGSD